MLLVALQQSSGDVTFSAAAIAVVTLLLGAMGTALGFAVKAYLAAVADLVADLRGQLVSKDKDIAYERSLREHTLAIAETTAAAYRGREESNRPGRGSPYA